MRPGGNAALSTEIAVFDLQTRTGKIARAPTAKEFETLFVKEVHPKIKEIVNANPLVFGEDGWLLSMDNEKIHGTGWKQIKQELNLDESKRLPLPAKSPDMHKVIEHVMAIIKSEFRKELGRLPNERLTAQGYCDLLKNIFDNKITKTGVMRDVESLVDTYKAIVARKGGWPDKKYR